MKPLFNPSALAIRIGLPHRLVVHVPNLVARSANLTPEKLLILLTLSTVALPALSQQYTISTVAGEPLGMAPVPGADVAVGLPLGVVADAAGNVYFLTILQSPLDASLNQNLLLKLDRNGILTRLAGGLEGYSGDGGPAAAATFREARGLALDPQGNLYVADSGNGLVRKISTSGTVTTVAGSGSDSGDGGLATNAALSGLTAVAVDASGNLYIAGSEYRIRKVSPAGIITTVAGTGVAGYSGDGGPGPTAQIGTVGGLATDSSGNLYFSDTLYTDVVIPGNDYGIIGMRIRKISAADGTVTTVAGNGTQGSSGDGGPATAAELDLTGAVTVDAAGNLYIAAINRIRKVSLKGIITTIAGNGTSYYSLDGIPATNSGAIVAFGMAMDNSGNLYFTDSSYPTGRVRKISESILVTVAGLGLGSANGIGDGGAATLAHLAAPVGLAIDSIGGIYISDTYNNRLRRVAPSGEIDTVAGVGVAGAVNDPTAAQDAYFLFPGGLVLDGGGNLYIADSGDSRIRMLSGGVVTTVAGTGAPDRPGFSGDGGPAVNALMNWPKDLVLDGSGNIYIADTGNHRIRVINSAGIMNTIAGTGEAKYGGDQGPAAGAQLNLPSGIALDGAGNLFVADTGNFRVRKISASGIITTVAGNGTQGHSGDGGPATLAQLNSPYGIRLDGAGNLYIADGTSVRMVSPAGMITTIAGTGVLGLSGDGGPATSAQIGAWGLAFDTTGNLFVADPWNNAIRVLIPSK